MGFKILHQLRGDLASIGAVGGGRAVARVAQNADFVFHLHHQHGVLFAVYFLDVVHQSGKGFGVGRHSGFAEGAQGFERTNDGNGFAFVDLNTREAGKVLLDPVRRVTRCAVLPTAEPEDDEAQMILPRLCDHAIERGVVELALFRLELRPGDGDQRGVQVAGDNLGPDRLQLLKAGGRVVGKLARGNQERLAVHDQLCGVALLLQVWNA